MHREVHQKWTSSEHKAPPRDEGLKYSVPFPRHHKGWGKSQKNFLQHWPGLVFSFCLLVASVDLPPHYSWSNVGHVGWRRKRWDTSRKEGWAGGCQGLWLKWIELHMMQSHLCLQHRCTLRAWHLMDVSSNATWQPLYSWNTAQHLAFMLARKQSSERKVVILMARVDID